MESTHTVEIAVTDFDRTLLPANAREVGTDDFRKAVTAVIEKDFKGFAGWVQIVVDDKRIRVSWRSEPEAPDAVEMAIDMLKHGDYAHGIQLLRLLLPAHPQDESIRFNLGMALSDLGQLDEAEKHLRAVLQANNDFTNARVALGVLMSRKGDYGYAAELLAQSVTMEPDNGYAHRNLGGCLLALKADVSLAEKHLRRATELLPQDASAWVGLGKALVAGGKPKEADAAFIKAIELQPFGDVAEVAKQERSKLAHGSFRSAEVGECRPDALMYCLSALQKFSSMPMPEVQKIAFEIAALGTKGINPNNPDKKYSLRSMPGSFTGLQLLSYMYVAFKRLSPETDIGFDLSKEYRAALGMHEGSKE